MRLLILGIVSPLCFISIHSLPAQDIRLSAVPTQWKGLPVPLESWGAVAFEVRNSGDEGQDVFVTSYFEQRPDQQFGRQLWCPPHSVREGWYLVKTPPDGGGTADVEAKPLNAMLIRRHGDIESAEAFEQSKRFETTLIRCTKSTAGTLLIADGEDMDSARLVTAARTATPRPRDFLVADSLPLPPVAAAYEGWTHIILASSRILEDPATVEALRQWTVQGGKLWIVLDKTGLEAALPFLADAGGLSVIDRVGLTSIEFASPLLETRVSGETRELENPAEMVRMVAEGFRTLYQVNGWDAAVRTQVGKGTVLVTTLAASGWLKPRDETTDPRFNAEIEELWHPIPECTSLGEQFWGWEESTPVSELAGVATQYVGYPVMSLTNVASALAIFCASILVGGILLWRAERLAWLAWFAPVAAVIATLAIGALSHQNRSSIPPTEAVIQVVEADSLGNMHVQGGLSVYSAANGDTEPRTDLGGQLEFVDPPPGQAKRLVWSDFGKVHWENLELNTGVHEFGFQIHQTHKPSRAIFSFNEDGVIGRIVGGDWTLPERGLLVSPSGQFAAPQLDADGNLVSTASHALAPGQLSASDVIDDREQTRMAILQKVFAEDRRLPLQPRLYFWTEPIDTGFQTQSEGRRVGDALVGLPVMYDRPAAGSRVFCPSYFIDFRSIAHANRSQSLAFSSITGEWSEVMLRKAQTTLEFHLPPSLRGLQVDRLRVFVDINAPDRDFELRALDRKNLKEDRQLALRKSPVGLLRFDLEGEDLPAVDENGAFRLGLDVGPLAGDVANEGDLADRRSHGWNFRRVWVEASGKMPD